MRQIKCLVKSIKQDSLLFALFSFARDTLVVADVLVLIGVLFYSLVCFFANWVG